MICHSDCYKAKAMVFSNGSFYSIFPFANCMYVKLVTSHFYLVCLLRNNYELVNQGLSFKSEKRLKLTSVSH